MSKCINVILHCFVLDIKEKPNLFYDIHLVAEKGKLLLFFLLFVLLILTQIISANLVYFFENYQKQS
jgi:hypothetical protein